MNDITPTVWFASIGIACCVYVASYCLVVAVQYIAKTVRNIQAFLKTLDH